MSAPSVLRRFQFKCPECQKTIQISSQQTDFHDVDCPRCNLPLTIKIPAPAQLSPVSTASTKADGTPPITAAESVPATAPVAATALRVDTSIADVPSLELHAAQEKAKPQTPATVEELTDIPVAPEKPSIPLANSVEQDPLHDFDEYYQPPPHSGSRNWMPIIAVAAGALVLSIGAISVFLAIRMATSSSATEAGKTGISPDDTTQSLARDFRALHHSFPDEARFGPPNAHRRTFGTPPGAANGLDHSSRGGRHFSGSRGFDNGTPDAGSEVVDDIVRRRTESRERMKNASQQLFNGEFSGPDSVRFVITPNKSNLSNTVMALARKLGSAKFIYSSSNNQGIAGVRFSGSLSEVVPLIEFGKVTQVDEQERIIYITAN
jgi:DNA-directed RNA polymerase subunit RPC12/RpoP